MDKQEGHVAAVKSQLLFPGLRNYTQLTFMIRGCGVLLSIWVIGGHERKHLKVVQIW